MKALEDKYITLIQDHELIIRKITGLYTDTKEDNNDLHQEILLQAWKSFAKFRGGSSFSTWLYRISLNTAMTHLKKEQKRNNTLSKIEHHPASSNSEANVQSEILYAIIKTLNGVDKMIITLHLDGYKNKEISEISGISINNTNVKIHRIKQEITRLINSSNYQNI